MMRKFKPVNVLLSAIFGLFISAPPVSAEDLCDPVEDFSPDGYVVELGTRSFRVCDDHRNDHQTPGFERVVVPFGTSTVRTHLKSYPEIEFLWGRLMLQDQDFDVPNNRSFSTRKADAGEIRLGASSYRIYFSKEPTDERRELISAGRELVNALLVYVPKYPKKLPAHFLVCDGDLQGEPRKFYDCVFYIDFSQDDDLYIYSKLVWAPNLGDGEPFDFDNVGLYVEALVKLFEKIEETSP